MKISKKYYSMLLGASMGVLMSFIMSIIITILNVGFVDNLFRIWLKAFSVGFAVGLPTAMVITPFVKRFVDKLTAE